MVFLLSFTHSFRCSLFNIIPRLDPVRAICHPAYSGCGENNRPQFIRCVDERQPKFHEGCISREDSVTPEAHPTARVGDYFANNYLTPTWCRIPMFGRKSINGSIEWLGVPSFLWNDGPHWTLNTLATYADWVGIVFSTSQNLSSGSGEYSDSVSVNWNRPVCVPPIYHRRIFENTRSYARRAHENLLMENRTYRMQSPSNFRNPIRGRLINRKDDALYDRWDFSVCQ